MVAPQAAQAAAPAAPETHRSQRLTQVDSVPEDKTMLVKFCLDGFTWQRFNNLEAHFQMGYAFVSVKGELQMDCCTRAAFNGIAKAVAKEEEAIPHVLGKVNDELEQLEIFQLPDSSIRLKLARPTESGIEYMRPCFVMDHKAFSLWLGRGGANCTYFCAYNTDFTLQDRCKASPADLRKRASTTTFGDLRRFAATVELGSLDAYVRREIREGRGRQGTARKLFKITINGVEHRHNIKTDDYETAKRWQKSYDLLSFIPDSVRLVTITTIEPLHSLRDTNS